MRRPQAIWLLLPFALASGCISMGPPHRPAAAPTTSVSSTTIDRPTLQARLLAEADLAMSEIGIAAREVLATNPPPKTRAFVQATRVAVSTLTTAIATSGAPEADVIDLYAFVRLRRWVTDQWLAGWPADAPEQALGRAMATIDSHVTILVQSLLNAEQLAKLNQLIEDWKTAHPDAPMVGVVRFDEFANLRSTPFGPSHDVELEPTLLTPVTDAQKELERTRLLGERIIFLVQRLPILARIQAEEVVFATLAQPDYQTLLSRLEGGSLSIDRLSQALNEARQRTKEIEDAIRGIDPGDLTPAKELATEVRTALADAKVALPEARATIVELKDAIEGAERVTTALRNLTQGPDGKPLDLSAASAASERLVTAAGDLRAAIEQAHALLSSDDATRRFEEIARSSRMGIDYFVWRLGQLLVIAASLTIVLRIVWVLTRQRGEQAPRQPRRS